MRSFLFIILIKLKEDVKKKKKKYYKKEIERLQEILTKTLNQLSVHNIKISCLKRELTLLFFFSNNIIRL